MQAVETSTIRTATIAKILLVPDVIKYVLIFIVGIFFLAIFFLYFGQFFIPLMLTALVLFVFMYLISKGGVSPTPTMTGVMVLSLLATFATGYFIQKFQLLKVPRTVQLLGNTANPQISLFLLTLALTTFLVLLVASKIYCGQWLCRR